MNIRSPITYARHCNKHENPPHALGARFPSQRLLKLTRLASRGANRRVAKGCDMRDIRPLKRDVPLDFTIRHPSAPGG